MWKVSKPCIKNKIFIQIFQDLGLELIFFTFWTEMLLQQPLHPLKELIRHIAEWEVQVSGGTRIYGGIEDNSKNLRRNHLLNNKFS